MKYLLFTLIVAGTIVACSPKTTEVVTTVETTEEVVTSNDGDMPTADIGEGKVVFLKNCTGCHYGNGPSDVKTIHNYSKSQFEAILPKMFKNAELNKDQSRQVSAYIYWELEN
ncbi:MAG: hypothetical protein AB8B56_01300 [Crocinitomicaceae bacterium]